MASNPKADVLATISAEGVVPVFCNADLEVTRRVGAERARMREDLDINDRVGGGDGFAPSLAWSFLDERAVQEAVEIGAAYRALKMTTSGDNSLMDKAEVLPTVTAKGARVVR